MWELYDGNNLKVKDVVVSVMGKRRKFRCDVTDGGNRVDDDDDPVAVNSINNVGGTDTVIVAEGYDSGVLS